MNNNRRGQALAEMMIMIPVLVILAGIAAGVAYMCSQGIKVQEAANYAARVQGQERVAGGADDTSIDRMNGVGASQSHDTDITDTSTQLSAADIQSHQGQVPNLSSVYGRYYSIVHNMFTQDEWKGLIIPAPQRGVDIDQVKVIRVMNSPTIFGTQIPQVIVTGTAYGGEDSSMFALPRWGCTGSDTSGDCDPYWAKNLRPENKSSANGL